MRYATTIIALAILAAVAMFLMSTGCQEKEWGYRKSPESRADDRATERSTDRALGDEAQLASAQLARNPAITNTIGKPELVAVFPDQMPTGVTVSRTGRVFVNFPRWGDPVQYTVAELKDGRAVPYPDAQINQAASNDDVNKLISVQSVVVDPRDRLWVLDTGAIKMEPSKPNGPKLICYDLASNKEVKRITFPTDVALPTTYLNDIRFDLKHGTAGLAYITDSSDKGPNGIIVVDLDSGRSWRVLNDHPSTKAQASFTPNVEGKPLMVRERGEAPKPLTIGADGIAISPDGRLLYYTPLTSRHLYSVNTDALARPATQPDAVAAPAVTDLGDRGFASDGLESDSAGRVYLTDYENNAIRRFDPQSKQYEIIAQDPRMIWPDTLSLSHDGYLYFTANQLNRQPKFNDGQDLREKPYALFRIRVDAWPVTR